MQNLDIKIIVLAIIMIYTITTFKKEVIKYKDTSSKVVLFGLFGRCLVVIGGLILIYERYFS